LVLANRNVVSGPNEAILLTIQTAGFNICVISAITAGGNITAGWIDQDTFGVSMPSCIFLVI